MKPKDAVNYWGNQTKVAAAIGVSEQSVRNWIKADRLPKIVQLAIETLTKGKLKANQDV